MIINISITNKRPAVDGAPVIVCNNKGSYTTQFTFDDEWNAYTKKVVRFVWIQKGKVKFKDVEMTGTTCTVPALSNTDKVRVGVFAGDICTTTPAVIPCVRSILCEGGTPSVENDKYYANEARAARDRAEAAAETAAVDATAAAEAEVTRLVGELGVVQVLGKSPTSVVSQAVTTALYNRNAKRITNLEQGVAEQFETDASVAYVKDVPANALPYAEIKKIGGMTYKDGNTLRSAKATEVKSVGVNLFDKSKITSAEKTVTGFKFTNTGGNGVPYGIGVLKNIAPYLKVGDNVTFYADCINAVNANGFFYLEGTKTDWFSGDFHVITQADLDKNVFAYGLSNAECQYNNLIITKIANAPYTPYTKHTLPIPEEVRPANGINENVYDFIEWAEDGSVKKTVKCGVKVLDGTENWTQDLSNSNPCFRTVLQTTEHGTPALCSHFKHGNYPYVLPAGTTGVFGWDSSFVNVYFASELTDVAAWKAYLATQYANGNPVTVVYELAEPEVTDISDLITADNLIGVEGGGTLTFENEYGYAVPSEVEYQVEV